MCPTLCHWEIIKVENVKFGVQLDWPLDNGHNSGHWLVVMVASINFNLFSSLASAKFQEN